MPPPIPPVGLAEALRSDMIYPQPYPQAMMHKETVIAPMGMYRGQAYREGFNAYR
jgi:energy-converting hydrogenase Eha subunit F